METKKRLNRNGLIQARVDQREMRDIVHKAEIYSRGRVSEFVREACLNYRPLRKVQK